MERTRTRAVRVARIPAGHLPALLAAALLAAAGCDDWDPFDTGLPDDDRPKTPATDRPDDPDRTSPAARPDAPPLPHYPMGLERADLSHWVFAPDRTGMFHEDRRNTVIRDFETGRLLRLTAEGDACDWSPDSRWLLYWNRGWCFVSRNGQTNRRVTTVEADADARPQWAGNLPVWHPDGPSLLILDAEGRVRLVPVTGEGSRQIATKEQIPVAYKASSPDFYVGPDGKWIVYMDLHRLGFLRSGGTGHRVAVRRLYRCSPPRWSADGSKVAFTADVMDPDHRRVRQMWRIDLPTGDLRAVCRAEPMKTDANRTVSAFSPTGRHVAYVADDRDQPRIVLAECESRLITKIHDEREAESPAFSPDGSRLAYVSEQRKDLVVLDLDEPRGLRLSCPGPFKRSLPEIEGWTEDGSAVRLWTKGFTLWEVAVDGSAVRRVWPSRWQGSVERTTFQTTRVPLEEENLTVPDPAFDEVPPAAAEVDAGVETLPVQVVEEEP